MSYPLVVFDLDGTLIDSLDDLAVAVNRLVGELGGRALEREAVGRMVGEGAVLLVSRALEASGLGHIDARTVLPRFLQIYDALLPGVTRPYDGIPEMLAAVSPACRLAVLTNKPTAATRKLLADLDLGRWFPDVIGGDGPLPRKPSPEGLQRLMELAGTTATHTLLVGDSTVDLLTAQAAGTDVCIARYGFGQAMFDPSALRGGEAFIDTPSDLVNLVLSGPRR